MSTNPQLEQELLAIWREVMNRPDLTAEDDFHSLGGTPSQGNVLIERLEKKLDKILHLSWLLVAPTVKEQVRWLESSWMGGPGEPLTPEVPPVPEEWRAMYKERFCTLEQIRPPTEKNPQACFILSPGRSGSTLLRAMLAGHPQLFSPPEVELLLFPDMELRYYGLMQGWSDQHGLESAVSYLWGCSHEEALARVKGWLEENLDTLEVFRRLQERCAPRLFVDKTTSYAAVRPALERLEFSFQDPLYIHLQRHPLAMIRSWKNAHFQQVVYAPPHCGAEINWLLSHQNTLAFLEKIPDSRQIALRYEDLVTEPEIQMRRLIDFLGLPFHEGLLQPYQGDRMARSASGRVSGDKKFLQRTKIDPRAAASSARRSEDGPLLEETASLARQFGYKDL